MRQQHRCRALFSETQQIIGTVLGTGWFKLVQSRRESHKRSESCRGRLKHGCGPIRARTSLGDIEGILARALGSLGQELRERDSFWNPSPFAVKGSLSRDQKHAEASA